jgi:hypothetical protein
LLITVSSEAETEKRIFLDLLMTISPAEATLLNLQELLMTVSSVDETESSYIQDWI